MAAVFKLGTFCVLSKSNASIVVCNLYHFVKSIHACTHIVYSTFIYALYIGLHLSENVYGSTLYK